MGHPMAKKSFRKRGDKFLKHQTGRFGFHDHDFNDGDDEEGKPLQRDGEYFDNEEE
jgi:hypothetical protein